MQALSKLRLRIRQKGLRRTLATLWARYVFFHWELLWLERDLLSPVPPNRLRPHPPTRQVNISEANVDAFARYFPEQIQTQRELAREGHTGHMYLDEAGDAVAMIWGSTRHYRDRHYYGCTFELQAGEFFQFCGELARPYFGTRLSVEAQLNLWAAKRELGCTRVVNVVAAHNLAALRMHQRMGYHEQGRVQHVYGLFGRWKLFRETRYSGSRLQPLRAATPAPASTAAQPAASTPDSSRQKTV